MIPALPIIYRRQMRLAAVAALNRARLTVDGNAVEIDSPGDWSLQQIDDSCPDNLYQIFVRTGSESKSSAVQAGMPQFNSTVGIEVKAVVTATTAENAQNYLELLWYFVENALLVDFTITNSVQCVSSVESQFDVVSKGSNHIASMSSTFNFEGFELYDGQALPPDPADLNNFPVTPTPAVQLNQMGIDLDLINVADPTGTHTNSEFPEFSTSVVPAPRTQGPDGRSEAALIIPL